MARRKRRRRLIPNTVTIPSERGNTRVNSGAFTFSGRESTRAVQIDPFHFPWCPICFSAEELTDEHVPMQALGGVVMTSTCKSCNNVLGSAVEEELRRAFHAEVRVRAVSSGKGPIRGFRDASAVLRRRQSGEAALIIQSAHPEFAELLEDQGSVGVSYSLLDPLLVEVALLKYAYLSACLWLQCIPTSPSADAVRAVLLAAREGRTQEVRDRLRSFVRVWPFIRIENADMVAPLVLVEPTSTQPEWMFVLAGSLAIRWPFSDVHPSDGDPT